MYAEIQCSYQFTDINRYTNANDGDINLWSFARDFMNTNHIENLNIDGIKAFRQAVAELLYHNSNFKGVI